MSGDVSVVIITYNQEEFVSEAIESVLDQTRSPDEVVVTDDGTTDATPEVVRGYAERNPGLVTALCNDENRGIAANVNRGLRASSGDLVTLLAGDDRFLPEKLEVETSRYREVPEANVVFSDTYETDADGNRFARCYGDEPPPTGDVFTHIFARDFWFRGWLQDSETFREVGLWDEELPLYADWDYTIRLTKHFDVAYTSRVLQEYRKHDESVTATLDREESIEYVEAVYEKNEHLLDDLPLEDRGYVRRALADFFLRERSFIARDRGNRLDAVRRYVRWLSNNPAEMTNLRRHASLVLPEAIRQM